MKKFLLKASKRTILGKKVKQLRKQKVLPGNLFGKKVESNAVQMPVAEFAKIYSEAHETSLVELDIDGSKHHVLIQNVQIHPLTGDFIHADFYQVDLKEKVKSKVPVELTGIAPAAEQKLGLVLELADEVEIEALPTELPEKLTLDVSSLKAVGDTLKAQDIKLPQGVVLLTKTDTEIVKIGELLTKEAEKLAAEEAAAKAAAVATAAANAPAAEAAESTEPTATVAATTPKETVAATPPKT